MSIRVEMISFIPAKARSAAGPKTRRPGSIRGRGRDGTVSASQLAASAPTASCPSAPMFHSPIANARATPRPVSISGMALISVCSIANGEPAAPAAITRYAVQAS